MSAGTVRLLWTVGWAFAICAALPAQEMVPFNVPGCGCSILMPGTPTYTTENVSQHDGVLVQRKTWTVEHKERNITYYRLSYEDYPSSEMINIPPAKALSNVRDGDAAGHALFYDVAISLNGVPGRAFTVKDPSGKLFIDVRIFYLNQRLYQLNVITGPSYTAVYRDSFMDSFKIESDPVSPTPPLDYKAEMAASTQQKLEAFTQQTSAWRALNPKPPLSEDVEKKRLLAEDDFANKNMAAAIEDYEAGVKLDPTWVQGWYNVAQLYAAQNDFEQAVFSMKHYLILLPDAPDAAEAKNDVLLWEAKAERAAGK